MLGPVEQVLVAAIRAVLPADQPIVAGAPLVPPTATRLAVQARKLTCLAPTPNETSTDARRPALLSRRFILSPDADPTNSGNTRNFTLPATALAEVEDVQSPSGRMVKRGDDYAVEGRIIRFYQNNPAAPVEVVTRGGPANGYQERTPCRVEFDLTAVAAAVTDVDTLLGLAVPVALAVFADRNTVTLAWNDAAGFRLRLLSVVASLTALERDTELVSAATWARGTARFVLQGELEIILATGAPDATGVIKDIRYSLA